ncbi:MAG TPA: glucosaminidase domain-containing protein, partial [Anaerolineae bacterium]|nr:glucosaminidase domain-containing protein [Anaerolineae bacterium]
AAGTTDENVNIGPIANGWIWAMTKEWDGKRYITSRQRFRKYSSIEDSFRDHGLLLATTPRYADAMRVVDDPREFARRIAAAGYATSPTYGDDLIRLMDKENLYRYDLPRNDAQFLGQSEYPTVNPGEIFQIYFDVKNTGFGTWSPTAGYSLGSINDQRFSAKDPQELDQLVLPGRVKRWTITMVAPIKPGDYRTAWQLIHGDARFGPEMYIDVHVQEPPSYPVWQIALAILAGAGIILSGGLFAFRRRNRKKPFEIPLNPR